MLEPDNSLSAPRLRFRGRQGPGPDDVPRIPLPKPVQTLRFLVRPRPFFERWRRELGETFHASILGPGELIFVSDPDSLKRLFGKRMEKG